MNIFTETADFIRELYRKKFILAQLSKRDFKNRYTGSVLGFLWIIIQPLVMTLILWVVFTYGLRTGVVSGIPMGCWLIVGLIAWNFFSETVSMSTTVLLEYSFLVKKVNFKIALLPLVKIISCLAFHLIFLVITMLILTANGIVFNIYWLQVFYYMTAMAFLSLGISWITASLNVFVRDVAQVVGIGMQFGFWLSPVVWSPAMMAADHPRILMALKLNPMLYIIDGYRKSLLYSQPFWQDVMGMSCFWGLTIVLMITGALLFRRLKPHFADVL